MFTGKGWTEKRFGLPHKNWVILAGLLGGFGSFWGGPLHSAHAFLGHLTVMDVVLER